MKQIKLILALAMAVLMFSGFWSGKSNDELRKERRSDNSEILRLLYKHAPESKKMIASSYGYATFSNVGVNLILISAEGGTGLAHNNKTKKNTYMNMGSTGMGMGFGAKEFMAVFIFVMLSQFIADLSLSVINLNASTLLRCCGIGLAPVFSSPLQHVHLSLFGYQKRS